MIFRAVFVKLLVLALLKLTNTQRMNGTPMREIKYMYFLKILFTHLTLIAFSTIGITTNVFSDTSAHPSSSKKLKKKVKETKNEDEDDDDDDDEEDGDGDEDCDDNKKEDKKDNNDPLNNIEAFPTTWLKPAAATLASDNAAATINQNNAPYTITGYFSPTCGHCGHFFKAELPVIRTKYINPGKIRFGIRPYCHHPIDFIVTQLAWNRGPDRFMDAFSLFMENQATWFEFLMIPVTEKEKRKEAINKMIEKLPTTVDRNKALVKFNINEENPTSSVLLFALANGFSVEEIDAATNSEKAEEVANRLIVAVIEAKDNEGKGITGIPTFYINEIYQANPLTLDDFESLIKTGKIVSRPKEPTQTTVPSASPVNNAAAQAFASIAPPQQ